MGAYAKLVPDRFYILGFQACHKVLVRLSGQVRG